MMSPQQYTGQRTPTLKSASDVQIADPTAGVPGAAPPLLNAMDVNIADPTAMGPGGGFLPSGGYVPPDPGSDIALENASNVQIADPTGGGTPGFGTQMLNYLKTPKGALTAGMLGMSGLSALTRPGLPGAAKTAGGLAGPAAAQAQQVISSGGYAAPQWSQQKASIDAQVNQEIADATRAMQQNAQNAGMGGANSDVVQQQIASIKDRAETQRQMLYAQALQQNVNNAVSELTGADQTLMGIADLQYQQDAQAKALAAQLAQDAAWLNIASSPSVPVGG
jgi:hypothetical protein